MTERTAEFVLSDAGGVTLSVRPSLPFSPEGVSLEASRVVLVGEHTRIPFEADENVITEVRAVDGLLLIEFPSTGSLPPAETELSLV